MNTHQLISRLGLADTEPEKWGALSRALLDLNAAYEALEDIVGPQEAYRALGLFAAFVRPPRRARGSTDRRYNAALTLAYRTAPRGKKEQAVRDVMRRYHREPTPPAVRSALRQVRRLLKSPMMGEEVMVATRSLLDPERTKPDK